MRYYTKDWYCLMQHQHFTSGLKKIPDREYTDDEIQAFYDQDLKAEIARDRRIHNTPPAAYDWMEELLTPDQFSPEAFLFENEETGELFHPDTPEIARQYFAQEQRRQKERFDARPTFDPAETITCFRDAYRAQLKYGFQNYPDWVQEVVDKRLLALNRIPSSAYKRLKKEETANRRAFEQINQAAAAALEQQNIPEEIRSQFCFHDADVLAVKKVRSNVELYLRKDGGWPGDTTPYIRINFRNVRYFDRETGFALRPKQNEYGELGTSCKYLYDELYRMENGYEIHMMFWTPKALRYLTIGCEEILFDDNIPLEAVMHDR